MPEDRDSNQNRDPQPEPLAPQPGTGYLRLFLDDDPARAEAFFDKFPDAHWVQTALECIEELKSKVWDEIHLDHDLEGEWFVDSERDDCGMEVVRWLTAEPRTHLMAAKFVVHTHNHNAAMVMVTQLGLAGFYVIEQPFGTAPKEPDKPDLDIFKPGGQNLDMPQHARKPGLDNKKTDRPSILMRILKWFVPPATVNRPWENAPGKEMQIPRRSSRKRDPMDEMGQDIDEPARDSRPNSGMGRPGPYVMPIQEDDLDSIRPQQRPRPGPRNNRDSF